MKLPIHFPATLSFIYLTAEKHSAYRTASREVTGSSLQIQSHPLAIANHVLRGAVEGGNLSKAPINCWGVTNQSGHFGHFSEVLQESILTTTAQTIKPVREDLLPYPLLTSAKTPYKPSISHPILGIKFSALGDPK